MLNRKAILNLCKEEKGSTLMLVLVYFSVLFIIGVSILTVAVSHYKIKIVEQEQKEQFYLAESGLDIIYAILSERVEAAVEAGKDRVEEYTATLEEEDIPEEFEPENADDYRNLNLELYIEFERDMQRTDPDYDCETIDADGNMVEEAVLELIDEKYREAYASQWSNFSDLISALEDTASSSYRGSIRPTSVDVIGDTPNTSFATLPNYGDRMAFAVQVESTENNVTKTVEAEFSIGIPEYDAPYSFETEMASIHYNPLFSKALAADGNIFIVGNTVDNPVTVNGDIHAFGAIRNLVDGTRINVPFNTSETLYYGGLVVGDIDRVSSPGPDIPDIVASRAGALTVNGNVSVASYVHTRGRNSSITINGDAYCNSLIVEELQPDDEQMFAAERDENCSIAVNGDVITEDDIELNGERSEIAISGSFYGFNTDSPIPNASSSIGINSDDIEDAGASNLTINGGGTGRAYYSFQDDSDPDNPVNVPGNGVYIGGTLSVGIDPVTIYQTGESVAVKLNYGAYQEKIYVVNEDDPEDRGYFHERVRFAEYDWYHPAIEFNDGIPLNADTKSTYFQKVHNEYSSLLNLGNGNIVLDNIRYSLGATISNNNVNVGAGSILDFEENFRVTRNEYRHHVNRMADHEITIDWEGDSSLTEVNSAVPEEMLMVADLYDFDSLPGTLEGFDEDGELFYASDSEDSIAILGPGYNDADLNAFDAESADSITTALGTDNEPFEPAIPGDDNRYVFTSENIHGIIVSQGDVYIAGRANFNGTIITTGNIYILDNNPKTFTNDDFDWDRIRPDNNYIVRTVYEHIRNDADNVGDFFTPYGINPRPFIYNSNTDFAPGTVTYYRHNPVIQIRNWKKIR